MDKKEKNQGNPGQEPDAPVVNGGNRTAPRRGAMLEALQPGDSPRAVADEERLVKLARVNAFGNFMKHLGAFAGRGYAPVEKAPANPGMEKVFSELRQARSAYRQQVQADDNGQTGPNSGQ